MVDWWLRLFCGCCCLFAGFFYLNGLFGFVGLNGLVNSVVISLCFTCVPPGVSAAGGLV